MLLFGGVETTEGMICNAVLHVLSDPEQRALLEADRSLLGAAVNESLRLDPAAPFVDRYATADVDLDGAAVRRGDLVRVSLRHANRDPAVFAEPERFDLRAPDLRLQLAFAQGPHVCSACTWRVSRRRRRSTACSTGCPASRSTRPGRR